MITRARAHVQGKVPADRSESARERGEVRKAARGEFPCRHVYPRRTAQPRVRVDRAVQEVAGLGCVCKGEVKPLLEYVHVATYEFLYALAAA